MLKKDWTSLLEEKPLWEEFLGPLACEQDFWVILNFQPFLA